ncbi:MAG: mycothiol-dependent nitroreductase Rv2466c family protein [Acidimicrobiales bacterium]
MQADFFFDPACAWSWRASRWLCEVAEQRPVEVRWRAFSWGLHRTLADQPLDRRLELAASARALRLVEAVRATHGEEPIGELYTRLGSGFHEQGLRAFEHAVGVISAMGLHPAFVDSLDDPRWDEVIRRSMVEAHSIADGHPDTPLLVLLGDGPKRGFHGPLFDPAPTGLAALSAWDGLSALIAAPGFLGLSRHHDTSDVVTGSMIPQPDVIDLTRS